MVQEEKKDLIERETWRRGAAIITGVGTGETAGGGYVM